MRLVYLSALFLPLVGVQFVVLFQWGFLPYGGGEVLDYFFCSVFLCVEDSFQVGVGNVGDSVSMLLDVISISVSILWLSWPGCGSGLNCWLSSSLADESVETIRERVGVDVSGLGFPVAVFGGECWVSGTEVVCLLNLLFDACLVRISEVRWFLGGIFASLALAGLSISRVFV